MADLKVVDLYNRSDENKIKAFSENSKNIALDAVGSKLKMSPDLILSPNTVDYLP